MINNPTVCAVMLTRDRPEMAARAIRAFRAQTYQNKSLLLVNSGKRLPFPEFPVHVNTMPASIGVLRNRANEFAKSAAVIIHWDDDDWSYPNRITEQVALLRLSGKECVGYREVLFWKEGEAFLYTNHNPRYCLGTSLCYWRSVWEKRPFPDLPKHKGGTAEDTEWLHGVDSLAASYDCYAPPMIATIHGANSSDYSFIHSSPSWRRAPEWDETVRSRMDQA